MRCCLYFPSGIDPPFHRLLTTSAKYRSNQVATMLSIKIRSKAEDSLQPSSIRICFIFSRTQVLAPSSSPSIATIRLSCAWKAKSPQTPIIALPFGPASSLAPAAQVTDRSIAPYGTSLLFDTRSKYRCSNCRAELVFVKFQTQAPSVGACGKLC